MKKQTLYITIGCPSSGKTSYYSTLNDVNIKYISSDSIREQLLGSESNQEKGHFIFLEMYSQMNSLLNKGFDVYLDATFVNRKSRKDIFKHLNYNIENINVVALVFKLDFDILIERDLNRKRTVGIDVIKKFYDKLTIPSLDEGFNEIKII